MSTPDPTDRRAPELSDEELLLRYRPILRLAAGERFRPMPIDPYVEACSLHVPTEEDTDHTEIPLGELKVADLGRDLPVGTYLKFIHPFERRRQVPNSLKELPRGLPQGYRLALVGLVGRLVDVLMHFINLFRPTVPWRTGDAAAVKAQPMQEQNKPSCYARVVEEQGWKALHYTFFYAMNDWRSRFRGINDHEADWEQILIYVDAEDNSPVWAAYASHDHSGDDLRRRWDDPELERIGHRPIIYVGAGSHASYFAAGEYTTGVHVHGLGFFVAIQRFFRRLVHLPTDVEGIDIPYIDQAPGDGDEIGPDSPQDLQVLPLDAEIPWVGNYRGLWGLDTHDPVDGERSPGGPMYERDGRIRAVWTDPLGWAGLHKVTPPSQRSDTDQQAESELERTEAELSDLYNRAQLLGQFPKVSPGGLAQVEQEILDRLRYQESLIRMLELTRAGETPTKDPRAHLVDPATPNQPAQGVRARLRSFWATISSAVILAIFGVSLLAPVGHRLQVLLGGLVLVLLIEALTKRRFLRATLVWLMVNFSATLLLTLWNWLSPELNVEAASVMFAAALVVLITNVVERFRG